MDIVAAQKFKTGLREYRHSVGQSPSSHIINSNSEESILDSFHFIPLLLSHKFIFVL
jgi:hypothetical protein